MMQNSLSRRSFLRGMAMGAGVVALAACAPAAPAPAGGAAPAADSGGAAAVPITLTWWDYMDGPEWPGARHAAGQIQRVADGRQG